MSTYKPSEHDGLKLDGTPDKRVNPEHGFGGDHERASELGKQGGKTGGSATEGDSESTGGSGGDGSDYKPTEHDGLRKDGQPDGRVKGN